MWDYFPLVRYMSHSEEQIRCVCMYVYVCLRACVGMFYECDYVYACARTTTRLILHLNVIRSIGMIHENLDLPSWVFHFCLKAWYVMDSWKLYLYSYGLQIHVTVGTTESMHPRFPTITIILY